VDVLLIKAAANYELGTPERGDVAFDRALRLAARNQMRIPFLLVPATIMEAMTEAAFTRSPPAAVAAMLEEVRGTATRLSGAVRLSSREREIVRSLASGRTAGEIADDLFISVNTVKSHLKSAYRKLDVTTRNEAVKRARELGLHVEITPD
jgi:DNA-binding CsgD family transcriptional regulator